jgi:hypothetical protein
MADIRAVVTLLFLSREEVALLLPLSYVIAVLPRSQNMASYFPAPRCIHAVRHLPAFSRKSARYAPAEQSKTAARRLLPQRKNDVSTPAATPAERVEGDRR